MEIRTLKFLIIAFILAIIIRLFFGVYIHDEFGDPYIFIKHRPTWKWKFYSPLGMSDLDINDLSETKKLEQLLFNEFIRDQGLSR